MARLIPLSEDRWIAADTVAELRVAPGGVWVVLRDGEEIYISDDDSRTRWQILNDLVQLVNQEVPGCRP